MIVMLNAGNECSLNEYMREALESRTPYNQKYKSVDIIIIACYSEWIPGARLTNEGYGEVSRHLFRWIEAVAGGLKDE